MKLSICIPTYNRARFIGEAIESVIAQATDEVEIAISDNASTDNTREIVTQYQKRFARFRYACNAENLGAELNGPKAIELATGDYCWILGSDDRISQGGIQTVLKALEAYPNLGGLHARNVGYNFEMTQRLPDGNPLLYQLRQTKLYEDAETCYAELGPYFGLCSGQIFNRRVIMEVINEGQWKDFCGVLGVQFYLAGAALKKAPRWLFIYEPCVDRRHGNMTFREDEPVPLHEDRVKDLEATVVFGEKVVRNLFGTKSVAYHASLKTAVAFAFASTIADAKIKEKLSSGATIQLLRLGLRYYARYPVFWIKAVPILLMPTSVVNLGRRIYRTVLTARFGPFFTSE